MYEVDRETKSTVLSYFAGITSVDKQNSNVHKISIESTLLCLKSTVDLNVMVVNLFVDSNSKWVNTWMDAEF